MIPLGVYDQLWKYTRDFSSSEQDSCVLHSVIYIYIYMYISKSLFLFQRNQRIVKIASMGKIAASDTFWHIVWLVDVK